MKNGVSGNHTSRYRRDPKFSGNAKDGWEAQYPEGEVSASLLRPSFAITNMAILAILCTFSITALATFYKFYSNFFKFDM